MSDGRLPTGLMLEAVLGQLPAKGIYYYITQKGNHHTGLLMIKLNSLAGEVRLRIQQRDFMTDTLEWIDAMPEEKVEEAQADEYIQRAMSRDPDLWVIEIEDREMKNPFEEI